MKIDKLVKSENGEVVDISINMSNEENAFFVAFAFNHLMKQGLLRINEETLPDGSQINDVELVQPAVVGE